jgi:hypothetical protein
VPDAPPLVIVSPVAGGGRAAAVGARLAEAIGDAAGDLRWTEASGHAAQLAPSPAPDRYLPSDE